MAALTPQVEVEQLPLAAPFRISGYVFELLDVVVVTLRGGDDVSLLEQPLRRGREADLDGFRSQVPIAADERALALGDLEALQGRFQVVNIKLDKCGGLTEGLAMAHEAQRLGFKLMVGNMVGTSLAMMGGDGSDPEHPIRYPITPDGQDWPFELPCRIGYYWV